MHAPVRPALALSLLLALGACGGRSAAPATAGGTLSKAGCTFDGSVPAYPSDLLPVLSYPVHRGALIRCAAPAQTPSPKIVDGNPADWIGESQRFGGSTRLAAGELIYNDYLFDAYGADDGVDATRVQRLDPLASVDQRFARLDAISQAAGDQLDVPSPVGALDHYGDRVELGDEADLFEVRWAAQGGEVLLLARYSTLTDPARAALVVLLDTAPGGGGDIGFGSGLGSQRFEQAVLLNADGVTLRDLASGSETVLAGAKVTVNAEGWTNTLEASLPASLFGTNAQVGVFSGKRTPEGLTPANVAYRDLEPVTIYFEKLQGLALGAGNIDSFTTEFQPDELRSGASETVTPGVGYHERQFYSGENISKEEGERGHLQPYGLYVPTGLAAAPALTPLTIWMHYRGGKAHSGAAWTPRLFQQLGEEPAHLMVSPRGRGTSTWYVSQAHQDFFEVFDDVHALFPTIDPDRRYLSGYSMGGYGTYLFGTLYPDLFAGGFSTSGPPTQGAWTGLGPDDASCDLPGGEIPEVGSATSPCFIEANEGNANAQLTWRLLENLRHFPLAINHGTNDELVFVSGIQRVGLRLLQLGYRYDFMMFFGYEHFSQAIVDEWGDGAAYLDHFVRPAHPRRITYKVSPALTHAVNTQRNGDGFLFSYNPDGAWWVDDLVVRDEDPDANPDVGDPEAFGMVDAQSFALPAATVLTIPRGVEVRTDTTAIATPALSIGAHSTPFARTGLDWLELGAEALSNGFSVSLTHIASASLDAAAMALDASQPVDGTVVSDGDSTLRIRGLSRELRVAVNGSEIPNAKSGDTVTLQLPAGTHSIRLEPR